jgi:hypothetical protein
MDMKSDYVKTIFRCEEHLYKRLRWLVGPSVGWSVCPHDAITWKTSYVAIASRRGGGRGYVAIPLRRDSFAPRD